ncbi:hypothetical protein B0O99DRAFT_189946 [Bisporella sp. PMI_857]|nr:hypothetical protein B0O99DRAFT_189946 [Bisporella sp. PMI_857]
MSASELPQSRSSSASLSSPPRSPSPSTQLNDSTHSITVNPAAPLMGPNGAILKKDGTVRKKPGRKPAPVDPNAPPKRKRKPRDPNAPPTQRRKPRESLGSNTAATAAAASSSSVAANVMAAAGPVPTAAGHAFAHDAQNPPPSSFFSAPPPPPPPPPPTQHQPPAPTPNPNPPPFRSASSGQNYDPIRSNYDPVSFPISQNIRFYSRMLLTCYTGTRNSCYA